MAHPRRFNDNEGVSVFTQSTTTQPSNPFTTMSEIYHILLDQELSRVISASQSTTFFTSINPRQTLEADSSTAGVPEATAAEGNTDPGTPNFKGLVNIGITFLVLVVVTIIVVSIFLIRRHRAATHPKKKKETSDPKLINYNGWQYVDVSAPAAAHLPNTGPRPAAGGGDYGHQSHGTQPPAYTARQNSHSIAAPRWR